MKDWTGQKVVIIGAARQGTALARYLAGKGARVTLTDSRPEQALQDARAALTGLEIEWACGGHPLSLLDGTSLLCISGGVPLNLPLVIEARRRGIPLSNDSQIFLEAVPCKVIGITGSAGKTTTTTLVGRMALGKDEGGRRKDEDNAVDSTSQRRHKELHPSSFILHTSKVWVGGNIGAPLISSVDEMQPGDLAVMELSSFQLEIMTRSPQVAAVLNITPNHLDRHGSMQAYRAAKARLLEFQSPEDAAILGRDDPGAWGLAGEVHGRLLSFGLEEPQEGQEGTFAGGEALYLKTRGQGTREIGSRQDILLRGEHNLLNVLAAGAIAAAAGLPLEAVSAGVRGFTGVSHRLEFGRSWGGADWYNDSIATAPERAMAAIRSFDEPLVLLAGGRDKDLPWGDWAALVRQRVDHLIVFGECADKILAAVQPGQRPFTIDRCSGLEQAVATAARIVQPGDVVLLSPGGTSFDEFRDFEERGEWYKKWVMHM